MQIETYGIHNVFLRPEDQSKNFKKHKFVCLFVFFKVLCFPGPVGLFLPVLTFSPLYLASI